MKLAVVIPPIKVARARILETSTFYSISLEKEQYRPKEHKTMVLTDDDANSYFS
jgi:hypothetical protein